MINITIIDSIGTPYDGDTLIKQGLGGSESAVILISKELFNLGFKVTVINNCLSDYSTEGMFSGVTYVDHKNISYPIEADIVISSRSVYPFQQRINSSLKILWLHDTFCVGDNLLEDMLTSGQIDEVFTLSDFHTSYISNCDHGKKRMFEVMKNKIFMTRNGIVKYHDFVDISKKDPNLFVYNAAVTKGMIPLVQRIWHRIKQKIPQAKLKIIGGYYKFKHDAPMDEQEIQWRELSSDQRLKDQDIEFLGIITQKEIADLLSKASLMIYPGAFPETFGISSLESLAYNTPLVTTRFGALEETAIDSACYKINYSIESNSLFQVNHEEQENKFVDLVLYAYSDTYLLQQKQHACSIVKNICTWNTIALQWKQHLYSKLNHYLPKEEYRTVSKINCEVSSVFGRRFSNKEDTYLPRNSQQRILVITPMFNCENYIKSCIESVLTQDYDNFHMYVIDDNSTDFSYHIAKSFETSYLTVIKNFENVGALRNQVDTIRQFSNPEDIILLVDGDDALVNDNQIFHFYNNLYDGSTEFSYGSCFSLADKISLIAQEYSPEVKSENKFREHLFNWNMPYTHLRTFKSYLMPNDDSVFKDENGEWFKAGGDTALFYNLIERCDSNKIKAVPNVFYLYNDLNQLNDYKINGEEQTMTTNKVLNQNQKISVIVPTMWRYERFPDFVNLLAEQSIVDEVIIIDNDSKISTHFFNTKIKVITQEKNIYVNPAWNLGVSLSRNNKLCIMNDDIEFDLNLLPKVASFISPDIGVIGLNPGNQEFNQIPLMNDNIDIVPWNGEHRFGFGCLMFMDKRNWLDIPDDLKIYYGDNFIFDEMIKHGKKNYLITNLNFYTPYAATTSDQNITSGFLIKESLIYSALQNNTLEIKYQEAVNTKSDINEHLRTLNIIGRQCSHITEFGVRTGNSSLAFLNTDAEVISYDIEFNSHAAFLFNQAKLENKKCQYVIGDSLKVDIEETDLLFIDTDHTFNQLSQELEKHHSKVKKFIVLHDTVTFGEELNLAIIDFMIKHSEWKYKFHAVNNNGLTILERKYQKKILIAISTNKYIEPETMKSIYDLEVPEGYKTEFQFFYGYSRAQVNNLIYHWGKQHDFIVLAQRDTVLPNDILSIIITNKQYSILHSVDYSIVSITKEIIDELHHPYFIPRETYAAEVQCLITKAEKSGYAAKQLLKR